MTLIPFRPATASPGLAARARSSPAAGERAGIARPALAACAALFAACASYEARPLVPDAELASLRAIGLDELQIEYVAPATPSDRGPAHFDPRDGLDESELASLALAINPELRAKRAEIGEAQALLVTAGLLPNPEIGAFLRPGIAGTSGTSVGIDALFELLKPDERPAKRAVAEARLDVVRAGIAADELRIVAAVRRARIAVLAAEHSARLLQQESKLREDAVALVRKQRELGETSEIALALVELDRTSVQRALRDSQGAVERDRRSLAALLGVPPTLELPLAGSGSDLAFLVHPDVTDEEIDARLLAGNPELQARAAEYRHAEQDLRLAVARQYPGLAIGPSYEKDAEGSEELGLGAILELPLFDQNQGGIAEGAANREHARALYVATLHDVRARAFEARAQLRRARSDIDLQQREVLPLVQRTESLFAAALSARELSVFEWLAVRARTIQVRGDLLDALTRYATAAVDLDSATGTRLVAVLTRTSDDDNPR